MKLSEIKGTRTLDVIADLIGPILSIAEDEAVAALFKREGMPKGVTTQKYMADWARRTVPVILKGHKEDIIAILAAVEGVSPAVYAGGLDLSKLLSDCAELLNDKAFVELFTSAQGTGTSSGSARVNTGDREA